MAAGIVYDGVENAEDRENGLFEGQKFWVSHKVPQRQHIMGLIKGNGGSVVDLEKQADIHLVDHLKYHSRPGSYSYRYVELSVRHGRLEELDNHVVGPPAGTVRQVGSIMTARKGGRTPYTDADDQLLYDWVKPLERQGLQTRGNEIYKQIEATYGRHPWQSWRDRWLKYVCHQRRSLSNNPVSARELPETETPRPQGTNNNSKADLRPPSTENVQSRGQVMRKPSLENAEEQEHSDAGQQDSQSTQGLSTEIMDALYEAAPHILEMSQELEMKAWKKFQSTHQSLSATEWRRCFHEYIKPKYLEEARRSRGKGSAKPKGHGRSNSGDHIESRGQTPPSDSKSSAPRHLRSPSWQPNTPSLLDRTTPFSANEARKRSPVRQSKSDSQESQMSNGGESGQLLEDLPVSGAMKRKRNTEIAKESQSSPKLPTPRRAAVSESPKKPRLALPEIQSTPEIVDQQSDSEQDGSPMFYPEEEGRISSKTRVIRSSPSANRMTDPLDVKLLSDESTGTNYHQTSDDQATSETSSLSPDEPVPGNRDDSNDEGSEVEVFETAPTYSTAMDPTLAKRDESSAPSEEYETARTARLETQDLFNTHTSLAAPHPFDTGLPAPPGGWSVLDSPTNTHIHTYDHTSSPPLPPSKSPSPSPSSSNPSSLPPTDLTDWLSTHVPPSLSPSPTLLNHQTLALSALSTITTSPGTLTPSDYALADKVLAHMRAHRGEVPMDVKGVWTTEDDEALGKGDARAIERVRRKHGDAALEGRWGVVEERRREEEEEEEEDDDDDLAVSGDVVG